MRFLLFGALLLSTPAIAQDAKPVEKPKEDKKICRLVEVTGSYLLARRQCLSKAEWERRAEQAQESFSRRLTNRLRPTDE